MNISQVIYQYINKPLTHQAVDDILSCVYQYDTKAEIKKIFTAYSEVLKTYNGLPITNLGFSFIENDVFQLDGTFINVFQAEVKLKLSNDWMILRNYLIPSSFPILVNFVIYLDKSTKNIKCEISY